MEGVELLTVIGPLQIVALDFRHGSDFAGRVIAELATLELSGTIRVLDVLFVRKDQETGDLVALDDQGEDLGAICGSLLGFGFETDPPPEPQSSLIGPSRGYSVKQIEAIGAGLQPGHSAAFVLLEHSWAKRFTVAVAEAGGVPLGEGLLSREAFATVAAEVESMVRALDELEIEIDRSAIRMGGE